MCLNPLFCTTEYGLMSAPINRPIAFVIALALIVEEGAA